MPWVVHAQPADDGARALDYLARYLFRVAISNSRLEQIDRGQVTFRYRNNRTQAIRRVTLSGVEFLRRFVQHVFPRRYGKVRYYRLSSPTRRSHLERARQLLHPSLAPSLSAVSPAAPTPPSIALPPCLLCHTGTLMLIAVLRPQCKVSP